MMTMLLSGSTMNTGPDGSRWRCIRRTCWPARWPGYAACMLALLLARWLGKSAERHLVLLLALIAVTVGQPACSICRCCWRCFPWA